ncbi:carbohydrate ABC transporter permease [Pseudomonas kurunegalensis]|uniref:carbohydrate ABC transporter permease n=1 Tax=Pseudomonas kurunegalensis TaxID=485880 RepID=UPI003B683EE2
MERKRVSFRWTVKAARRLGVYLVLLGFVLFFIAPLVVMAIASFKDLDAVQHTSIISWPQSPTLEPWRVAWSSACVGTSCVGLQGFYANTFAIVIPAVIVSALIGAVNGYALSKYSFKGANLVYALILFGTFAPYQVMLIPISKALSLLGLSSGIGGLILLHTVYGLPMTTMFFRNYFMTVPQELVHAAQVDGAKFWRIFWTVIMPMSIPMVVVTVIWQFTSIWNDFLFGVSYTSGENVPIMVALNNMVSTSAGARPYNVHMAGALLAALPTLVIYLVAGKYFVRGLMAGAVKG